MTRPGLPHPTPVNPPHLAQTTNPVINATNGNTPLALAAATTRPGFSQLGKSAFDWDVYKNRKSALQYLKRHRRGIDTILETEDGSFYEFVHSQVISAFGDKLNTFLQENGNYVRTYKNHKFHNNNNGNNNNNNNRPGIKLIRLPKVNRYTLGILVECAYTGYIRTDLPSGGIWQVIEMADCYEMVDVIRACCAFLLKNLNRSNCIHFYHIGIKYKHPLQRSAWHKIRANFKYILADDLAARSRKSSDPTELQTQKAAGAVASAGELNILRRARVDDNSNINLKSLASIKFEHFEPLLAHDRLNIDDEESVWHAIKLWCYENRAQRASKIVQLLPCMRFPRFRTGTEFSPCQIWRDPLIMSNKQAQQQLAILDRNHRDYIAPNGSYSIARDGFQLPCAVNPRQLRPRIPHSVLLAIGGWQQGQPTTLIESYDVNCNMWFESHKRTMSPLAYHGIESINGLLYICGGTDGSEILNEMFTFDPVRGDCAQKPSMRESRCYVSTAYLDGFMYAIGGHNGSQRMKSVERFDIVNESWSHIQDMNVARSDASACVHGHKIYIAGGLNEQVIESSVEFYNPQDNSWTFLTGMIMPRTSFSLILYHGLLLAIGGNNGTERLSSVEQYNFQTKTWSHHSNMRHRRSTFSAALMDDSKLIVVGGYNGQTPFNQVEMFDEGEGDWISLQRIRYDRSGLKAVVVSDLPNTADYTYLGHNTLNASYNIREI